jgi:hypothetical protein
MGQVQLCFFCFFSPCFRLWSSHNLINIPEILMVVMIEEKGVLSALNAMLRNDT